MKFNQWFHKIETPRLSKEVAEVIVSDEIISDLLEHPVLGSWDQDLNTISPMAEVIDEMAGMIEQVTNAASEIKTPEVILKYHLMPDYILIRAFEIDGKRRWTVLLDRP